ncbi:hypothetical protein BDW72DRAFT_208926 [Aspergillus terricola var. indicus]
MRPTSRDGFGIAIICALSLEAEAVEALFDETYDRPSESYKKQPGDNNAYVNGRIGNHNVVLCCMSRMGKGNAASVAASLQISYRRIQVALVVGICGGAPCTPAKEEIFLGDVIISDAVIEYDFGRKYRHGFERKTGVKDTLGRPNQEIQSLLKGLGLQQSRRDLHTKMLHHLQVLQGLQPRWRQPSSAEDVLYEASYQHRHYSPSSARPCLCLDDMSDEVCPTALDTSCILLGCAEDRIHRRRHCTEMCNPTVQIGTVASADTVMKSGEHRDHLVKSESVIGFEMEGAGVWNNISCIIIKGVCDYADSHKNKAWQPYAAATGAATAKALLEYWEPSVIEEANEFHIPLDLTAVPAIEGFIGREEELSSLWKHLQPASSQTQRLPSSTALGMQRANQVLQWLAKPGNTRWLIIFNNINQYSPLEGHGDCKYNIYKFFPRADHESIIITSRLQILTELGMSFPVQKLLPKDATQLLLQSSGFSTKDILRMGAQQVVIAGAFMRQTGTTVKEYLELYRTFLQGNMVQTWIITYQEIQKHDPTAAQLLLLLAFFDNQDIWFKLIQSGLDSSDPPPWFEMAVSSKLVFKTKVKALVKFSFVKTKQEEGSYTLHPIIQDWCCHITASNNITNQLHKLAFISVGFMVPSNSARGYAEIKQELEEAEEVYQRALAGYQKALGSDHTSTLNTVGNLGNLYKNQGKLEEAEEMYQLALAGYQKVLGPDHLKTRLVASSLLSLPSLRAEQDTSRHIHDPPPAAQAIGLNTLGGHLTQRPRKRDILLRILRR